MQHTSQRKGSILIVMHTEKPFRGFLKDFLKDPLKDFLRDFLWKPKENSISAREVRWRKESGFLNGAGARWGGTYLVKTFLAYRNLSGFLIFLILAES